MTAENGATASESIRLPKPVRGPLRSVAFWIALLAVLAFNLALKPSMFGIDAISMELRAVAVAAGLAILGVAISVRLSEHRVVQADRDRFAREVAARVMAGEPAPPFSLYLRPFLTDGVLTDYQGIYGINLLSPFAIAELGQRRDSEHAAAKALQRHAPLIAIGRPDKRLGAGRVESDDASWRALFAALSKRAERIIVVPLAQPSTASELEAIAASPELLEKTVFVRPANRWRFKFGFAPDENVKSVAGMWAVSREILQRHLPNFPPFAGGARLFVFDRDGGLTNWWGNGACTSQTATGVAPFVVRGARLPRFHLSLLVWLLITGLVSGAPYSIYSSGDPWAGMLIPGALSLLAFWFFFHQVGKGDVPYTVTRAIAFAVAVLIAADYTAILWSGNGLREGDAVLGSVPTLVAGVGWSVLIGMAISEVYQMRIVWASLVIGVVSQLVILPAGYYLASFYIQAQADPHIPQWMTTWAHTIGSGLIYALFSAPLAVVVARRNKSNVFLALLISIVMSILIIFLGKQLFAASAALGATEVGQFFSMGSTGLTIFAVGLVNSALHLLLPAAISAAARRGRAWATPLAKAG